MFGEKQTEMGLPVWQSPKYVQSKEFAMKLIESKQYDVNEGDFWILMNQSKDKKTMIYSGLIISHNGCLKINEKLDNKFNPSCVTLDKEGWGGSLVYTYCDEDVYEVGEVTTSNCKNAYPYAMAFKRCFDRVVLKKSKLAFYGVYSDSEADEFKEPDKVDIEEQKPKDRKVTNSELSRLIGEMGKKKESQEQICERYGVNDIKELTLTQYNNCLVSLAKTEVA